MSSILPLRIAVAEERSNALDAPRSHAPSAPEPWLKKRLEWFQDLKFGFMMHWGAYSQWGCIESWPLVEEDKWARPDDLKAAEKPLPYVWETCMTMGDQWSFKPNDNYKSTHRLICLLVDIVGKGGNFLLNVGPQTDGELPAAAQQRMKEIGEWLRVNGDAFFGTRPVAPYKDGQVVFTHKRHKSYAIYLTAKEQDGLPGEIQFSALRPKPGSRVRLLGSNKPLHWTTSTEGRTRVEVPVELRNSPPCRYAFAFEFVTE